MNKHGMKTGLAVVLLAVGMVLGTGPGVEAQSPRSLFEQYADSPREQLEKETAAMGRKLSEMFSQASVTEGEQRIQSTQYMANLKRALIYGAHLAVFCGYERDLQFARDHELFQGLPDAVTDALDRQPAEERSAFTGRKYQRLKENVEEEVETYHDLMRQALDACEEMVSDKLLVLQDNQANRERVDALLKSALYRDYAKKQADLARGWPQLAVRLRSQLDLWRPRAPQPGDALIDRAITGAL